jgi:endonuclease-3 related protein
MQRESNRPGINEFYATLLSAWGPQAWWPAETAFEMMVGAILTQATQWHNVKLALAALKQAGLLQAERMLQATPEELAELIRPSGYFRQKAQRLQTLCRWFVAHYQADPRRLFAQPWPKVREELLRLPGIGPETADCILLYAGSKKVFVVDAYTRRLLSRHGVLAQNTPYDQMQAYFHQHFKGTTQDYNEYHALIVETGKRYCSKRNPKCEQCPLGIYPHTIKEG